MIRHLLFAWIDWDPPREAFTIPYFQHPIVWYGICFAFGFFLAYCCLYYLFTTLVQEQTVLHLNDVRHWNLLIKKLQEGQKTKNHPLSVILSRFSPSLAMRIKMTTLSESVESGLKENMLRELNFILKDPSGSFSRKTLEKMFPQTLFPAAHTSRLLLDSLSWYIVIGTILGARLGHAIFYDWEYYLTHPFSIFRIWEGGLASHGGAIGILIALGFFYSCRIKKNLPEVSFLSFLDIFVIPVPLAGAFIRIGNFINQEIVGTPSSLPWAVLFGHPLEGGERIPRHPVQLYEALAYVGIFIAALCIWRFYRKSLNPGFLSGFVIALIFIFRFFLEFFKASQESLFSDGFLEAGQYLSLPFILLGLFLLFISIKKSKSNVF